MEDFEDSGTIMFGSGVLLTTKKGKQYMGKLEMIDGKFIHLKATYITGVKPVVVPQDQVDNLLEVLSRRSKASLWVDLARTKNVVVRGVTKDQMIRLRAKQIIEAAVAKAEAKPEYTLQQLKKATYTLIPHSNVADIKSMEDIGVGIALEELDSPELDMIAARVYHGEYDADTGSTNGTDLPDEQGAAEEAEEDSGDRG